MRDGERVIELAPCAHIDGAADVDCDRQHERNGILFGAMYVAAIMPVVIAVVIAVVKPVIIAFTIAVVVPVITAV